MLLPTKKKKKKRQVASKLRRKYHQITSAQSVTASSRSTAGWWVCWVSKLPLSMQDAGPAAAALPEYFHHGLCKWTSSCPTQVPSQLAT